MQARLGQISPELRARAEQLDQNRAAEERKRQAVELWKAARVPERYLEADLRQLGSSKGLPVEYHSAAQALMRLLQRPAILVLTGDYGAGKTWLACGLIREFCRVAKSGRYCRSIDFFSDLKSTYSKAATVTEAQVVEGYRKPQLLVIDEFDVASDSAWEEIVFAGLIDARYAAVRSTVIISNRTVQDLAARLGNRLVDRIRDDGGVIQCTWGSLRGGRR